MLYTTLDLCYRMTVAILLATDIQAWTDSNNTENDHIIPPIYINMHIDQQLSTTIVQQLAIALQPHISKWWDFLWESMFFLLDSFLAIDYTHSMHTRRPRIKLNYTRNNKSVRIDLVRVVKLTCERDKYLSTKMKREKSRKAILKKKKKDRKKQRQLLNVVGP